MTPPAPSQHQTAWRTDIGRVRSENQDTCDEFRSPSGALLLVVADGMGGHRGGATASRVAVEAIGEVFALSPRPGAEMLREAMRAANQRVLRTATLRPELYGMGTTCVALLVDAAGAAWVAHVGDSRAYRLREGVLQALTADHSAVAELERRGMISAEEAAIHPRRNELLRSIGVDEAVEVDVAEVDVAPGDRFLLCSDGLCGVIPDAEIAAVLHDGTPQQAVQQLVDAANASGGPDNVTVMVSAVPAAGATASAQQAAGRRLRRLALGAALLAAVVLGIWLLR